MTVAIVTGAASGIGRAIAERLAEDATVVAADLNEAGHHWVRCDVTDEADLAALAREAARLGPVRVLVNCAGISTKMPIEETAGADWRRILEVNLTGSALAIKHVVPAMRRAGGGSIVNIASLASWMTASAHNTAYAASKGGVVALTRSLVYELGPAGIRVNAVAPGIVDTPLLRAGHSAEWYADRESRIPLGRLAETSEIAEVVAFLAGAASSYLTGQLLVADGGLTAVMYQKG